MSAKLYPIKIVFIKDGTMYLYTTDSQIFSITLGHPDRFNFWRPDAHSQLSEDRAKIKITAETENCHYEELRTDEKTKELAETLYAYLSGKMKTSEEWSKLFIYKIVDPDGWDRTNFQHSWYEELITREEFENRAIKSTVEFRRKWMDEDD